MTAPAAPPLAGLTTAEVQERVAQGRVNLVPDAPVRTIGEIIRANVITRVNAIVGGLFVLILIAGQPKDALFAGVIISNSAIGIIQELRARKTLNELAVLNAPKARVVRDGSTHELGVSQVVADELLVLQPGDQVVVDGEVVQAIGLEIDESLLTGEAEPVEKHETDGVLSGSFVSAGSGCYRATHIGADSYAAKLANEARKFALAPSDLRRGVDRILRWQLLIIPPAAILLFIRLVNEEAWQEALTGMVAASVAMVPDGLVLLTSIAFIVGVLALARRRALAKELASVELLARVDTLCLDKTGTITTGEISLGGIEPIAPHDEAFARQVLGAMGAADPNPNPTLKAIADGFAAPAQGWTLTDSTPFSSARKWAGAHFAEQGSFYLGAPDILLDADDADGRARVDTDTEQGKRVLVVTHSRHQYNGETLPDERSPVAIIVLEDTVRPDAREILEFFITQDVDLKVISGDHPQTVAAVARRAGVPNADVAFDARNLPEDRDAMAELLEQHAVFGRVTPHQKRAMVGALQSRGRTVAMTGDGVNDVLALKDADMGISMGSGSAATRAVAQLVLLDNQFATLPRVLSEGRRVINNIERVANLFITKSTYAVLLTSLVAIFGMPYPFLPRHLTLIGSFSIGIPGLLLALAPNDKLVQKGFLDRVLRFSIPAGISAAAATFTAYVLARREGGLNLGEERTAATMTLLVIGLVILIVVSRPLRAWKVTLAAAMGAFYVAVLLIEPLKDYFEFDHPPDVIWLEIILCAGAGAAGVVLLPRYLPWGRHPN
jgi:cation-transporting P-type ATPase E